MICKSTTNIDDKKDSIDYNEENEEKVAMLIDAKTDVLLQTADCIISNQRETKELKIKVLLDPGSQKKYLSNVVNDYLKLDAITKQNVAIKTFGSTNGQLKELGEFEFEGVAWKLLEIVYVRIRCSSCLGCCKRSEN